MADPARSRSSASPGDVPAAPLGGSRADALRRLQFGVIGVLGVILLVGLATVIENRAKEVEQASVPDAAATTEPNPPAEQQDPLAEAGVLPEMPASATPEPTQSTTARQTDLPPPRPRATAQSGQAADNP